MALPPPPPDPVCHPQFALWCFERRLKLREIAEALKPCSIETARRIQLPFGDENRRIPQPDLMNRIVTWTDGAVQPASFYPSAEVLEAINGRVA